MTSYEIHRDDHGYAALYVDGKLDRGPCDAYLIDERLYELLGVKVVDDDAFLRGGTGRGEPASAQTLAEVEEYRRQRDEKLAEAERLRQQAAELEVRAATLRKEAGR